MPSHEGTYLLCQFPNENEDVDIVTRSQLKMNLSDEDIERAIATKSPVSIMWPVSSKDGSKGKMAKFQTCTAILLACGTGERNMHVIRR